MKTCLIVDVETNGDKDNPICIEIGWVLYSIERQTMLNCGSFLLNQGVENKAQLINRIPSPVPDGQYGVRFYEHFCQLFLDIINYSIDCIVAHNKAFDKEIIEKIIDDDRYYQSIPWLCTYEDFQLFPPEYQGKWDLISLAQFYGVGISATHRAIEDCLLIAKIFNRVTDLKAHFELAVKRLKKTLVIAFLSYKEKDKAKELNLYYNKDHNCYVGIIPECEFNESDYPFPIITYRIDGDYNLKEIIEDSSEWISAEISYDDKDLAKQHGFKWKNKKWIKRVPVHVLALKTLNFPFPVKAFSPSSSND